MKRVYGVTRKLINSKMTIENLDSTALVHKAMEHVNRKEPEKALNLLTSIACEVPPPPVLYHVKGIALHQIGNHASAIDSMLLALRLGDSSAALPIHIINVGHNANLLTVDLIGQLLRGLFDNFDKGHIARSIVAMSREIQFTRERNLEHLTKVFEHFFLPAMQWSLDNGFPDLALGFESAIWSVYLKKMEADERNKSCYLKVAPMFVRFGHRYRRNLPELELFDDGGPEKIAFLVTNAVLLAHTEVLLNYVKGCAQLKAPSVTPIVYCFSGESTEMVDAFARFGVEVVQLQQRLPHLNNRSFEKLLEFRKILQQARVNHLVWISVEVMMSMAFSIRLAPVQSWWAMKYNNLELEDMDGHITGGSVYRFKNINGRRWRIALAGVDNWFDPEQTSLAVEVKKKYAEKTVLATIAREEKLTDKNYLNSICDILEQNPTTVFLWAGRTQLPMIQRHFENRQVVRQTEFIGWVNTRLYAQVIDIFLDSYPFPCGFTAFQSMAAGKPVVFFACMESEKAGIVSTIMSGFNSEEGTPEERSIFHSIFSDQKGEILVNIARNQSEYVAMAKRLVVDLNWRKACGSAAKEFMSTYLSDPVNFANDCSRHFIELIALKRTSLSSELVNHESGS